jgi:26S proteasome regulatory subunit (ATPase 3-interacting protein)
LTAGKASVYHALQQSADAATPEQLAAMDAETEVLRVELNDLKTEEKSLKANVGSLTSGMTISELEKEAAELERRKAELVARLEPLRAGTVKPVSADERDKAEREFKMWRTRAATRKKIAMELWEMLTEELPDGMSKEDMWVRAIDLVVSSIVAFEG